MSPLMLALCTNCTMRLLNHNKGTVKEQKLWVLAYNRHIITRDSSRIGDTQFSLNKNTYFRASHNRIKNLKTLNNQKRPKVCLVFFGITSHSLHFHKGTTASAIQTPLKGKIPFLPKIIKGPQRRIKRKLTTSLTKLGLVSSFLSTRENRIYNGTSLFPKLFNPQPRTSPPSHSKERIIRLSHRQLSPASWLNRAASGEDSDLKFGDSMISQLLCDCCFQSARRCGREGH